MHISAHQTDAKKGFLFKQSTFISTNIQYNQHALPPFFCYISQIVTLKKLFYSVMARWALWEMIYAWRQEAGYAAAHSGKSCRGWEAFGWTDRDEGVRVSEVTKSRRVMTITTTMGRTCREKGTKNRSGFWSFASNLSGRRLLPWLWECVSAFLQQQFWDQCVQNLRTGPLPIPEVPKTHKTNRRWTGF